MIKSVKVFLCITILLLSTIGICHAADYKKSVGLGWQYGILGGQLSIATPAGKSRISLGIGALSLGHEFVFNQKYAVGFQVFRMWILDITDGAGLVANYYFNSANEKGWLIGIETSWYEDISFLGPDDPETINRTLLSVGYTF